MKIYIPTCNKTIYLIESLLFSLKKYWYDYEKYDIIILGYTYPEFELDKNVSFYSMKKDDTVNRWAIDLKEFFEGITDDYFIYMNDDCPLSRKIDLELLNLFFDIISENKNSKIGKISLTKDLSNRGHNNIGNYDNFNLIEAHQNSEYRTSTQFSIWNRNYFLKYLKDDMTPWQFELQHPKNDGYSILGTGSRYCLDFYHLRRMYGKPDNWYISTHEQKKLEIESDEYNFIKSIMDKGD